MIYKLKLALLAVLISGAACFTPVAKADEWDKMTVLTFNEPIEIPGKVLPAGTYVFKLADSESDRTIVQIFTEDQKQLIATVLGIPDYREDPAGNTVVTFEERPSGSPEALHTWFYPGDNYGVEFSYPKTEMAAKTEAAAPLVSTPAPTTPEPKAQRAVSETPATQNDGSVVVREETVVMAQAEPAVPADDTQADTQDTASTVPAELPQTAGNFALIPLLGVALLSGGFFAMRQAKEQS